MRKLALFTAALMLAGCVTESASQVGGDYPKMDQAGNVYPEQCKGPIVQGKDNSYSLKGDTLDSEKIWVTFVPASELPKGYSGFNAGGAVFIDRNLAGWRRDDAIRHELCHSIAGNWHQNSEIVTK